MSNVNNAHNNFVWSLIEPLNPSWAMPVGVTFSFECTCAWKADQADEYSLHLPVHGPQWGPHSEYSLVNTGAGQQFLRCAEIRPHMKKNSYSVFTSAFILFFPLTSYHTSTKVS